MSSYHDDCFVVVDQCDRWFDAVSQAKNAPFNFRNNVAKIAFCFDNFKVRGASK